jgi:DNA-3-methyladenine glycosylase
MRPRKLARTFYRRGAEPVASDLIGKVLVHRVDGRELRARIVETEAYVGPHDLACHASKGRTKRTEVMFGPPGHAYVYFIYGMYEMLNLVCAEEGDAQAVLIRAAEPLDGWDADLSGPGKLARAMRIKLTDNGADLTGDKLYVLDDGLRPPPRIARSKRIGVEYARHWSDQPLRFFDADSPAVSKLPKPRPRSSRRGKR